MTDPLGRSVSRKPPVQCGNCGVEITFEPGQLVGDPAAVRAVKLQRDALVAWREWWDARLTEPDLPAPVPQTDAALNAPPGGVHDRS